MAITGIGLISFNGSTVLQLNPLGDLLARAGGPGLGRLLHPDPQDRGPRLRQLAGHRRIFFYGLLFMLPCLPVFGFSWDAARLLKPVNFLNLLFLGLWASALCFVTWTFSLKRLGAH